MKYHRDVFVITNGQTTKVIRVESHAEIDAYDALNAASPKLAAPRPGDYRELKVYCGGSN